MNSELLLALALRSFAPPIVCLAVVALLRKSSASIRRVSWLMCFVALAALPFTLLSLPAVPVVDHAQATRASASMVQTSGFGKAQENAPAETVPQPPNGECSPAIASSLPRDLQSGLIDRTPLSVIQVVMVVWLGGMLLVLTQWLVGLLRLSKLPLQAVQDEKLLSELKIACTGQRFKSLPSLVMSSAVAAPMVFGNIRPRLVLPVEAVCWSAETRRAIFIHECAHIRRKDWLGLTFSRMVAAVYWFNPVVWLAALQFRAECEAAADDAVLLNGVAPTVYASELLRIATEVRPSRIAGSLAIVEVGPLKLRIARLLEKNRSRGAAPPLAIGLSLALSCLLAIALGVTYRTIDSQVISHDGFADLGNGRHLRIAAIVERTATGTTAWNMRGELLPNGMPLPDHNWPGSPDGDGPNARYIVFAQNFQDEGIESLDRGEGALTSSPTAFQVVSSVTPGMGFSVTRIDGDDLYVASLNSTGAPYATIRCAVPSGQLIKLDEMKPGGASSYSRQSPIRWSMSDEEQVKRTNAKGQTVITQGPPTGPAEPGSIQIISHTTKFGIDVPGSLQGKELVLDFKTPSNINRAIIAGEPNGLGTSARRLTFAPGIDPRTIMSVVLSERPRAKIVFDHIPLNPGNAVAQTPELDVPSLKTIRNDNTPGALLGICDLNHPEWGFWRPNGSPMPAIVGVQAPRNSGSPLPTGAANRKVGLLFRTGISSKDRVTASDVSGVLLAHSIEVVYTPSGRYDLETLFLDPNVKSTRLISKAPTADAVIARINLSLAPPSTMSKNAIAFLANRITPKATRYRFAPKLAPPFDIMDRSLQFLYADKPAPADSLQGYCTDWEDGALALEANHPEKIVAANVLEHGYAYYSYPGVVLYPPNRLGL